MDEIVVRREWDSIRRLFQDPFASETCQERSLYRHFCCITYVTSVTEKSSVDHRDSVYGMDGMDGGLLRSQHKPRNWISGRPITRSLYRDSVEVIVLQQHTNPRGCQSTRKLHKTKNAVSWKNQRVKNLDCFSDWAAVGRLGSSLA